MVSSARTFLPEVEEGKAADSRDPLLTHRDTITPREPAKEDWLCGRMGPRSRDAVSDFHYTLLPIDRGSTSRPSQFS